MNVAILGPVWFPIPPTGYGGIESVVALLADGLVEAGHEVTLFASGDSRTNARLASVFREAQPSRIGSASIDLRHALACYERAAEFDLVNDHSGPLAAALGGLVSTPVVHTVHGPLDDVARGSYEAVATLAPRVGLVSLSLSQRKPAPNLPWVANCANGLDVAAYPFRRERGDYLLYLGRLCPEKGAHRAIEIARRAGLPIKLAGKKREPAEEKYFDEAVRPLLGEGAEYLGETSHERKVQLLQHARATLFPIDWEEPFGLVMIESMASGTPVIATRRGAVPEVVEHGRSGVVVDDWADMVDAIADADRIDAVECRRSVEERFSPERMVREYEAVYGAVASTPVPAAVAAHAG